MDDATRVSECVGREGETVTKEDLFIGTGGSILSAAQEIAQLKLGMRAIQNATRDRKSLGYIRDIADKALGQSK